MAIIPMFNPFKKQLTESQKAVLGIKESPVSSPQSPEPRSGEVSAEQSSVASEQTETKTEDSGQKTFQYVTKDMVLGDIVERFPQAAFVMSQFGLHCVGCHANVFDTVEAGAKVHGMSDSEIAEMLAEVNKVIADGEREAEAELNKIKAEEAQK